MPAHVIVPRKENESITSMFRKVVDELLIECQNVSESIIHRLPIKEHDLSTALDTQSVDYYSISRIVGKAYVTTRRIKLEIQECQAELSLTIRKEYAESGGVKPTEASLNDSAAVNPKIKELSLLRWKAEDIFAETTSLKEAFEHRRSMLNNTVSLVMSGLTDSVAANKVTDYSLAIKAKKAEAGNSI